MLVEAVIMALVGAGIGWFTNRIAIKMLFRPQKPVKIPLSKIYIQGLIPRRREEIACSIGEVVEKELVSIEEIVVQLAAEKNRTEIIFAIKRKVSEIVKTRLPAIIPSYLKDLVVGYINDIIDQQANLMISELVEKIIHKAAMEMDLRAMIEKKINEFDLDKLEGIILAVASRELKHIEYLGAVIGFFIGLAQALIIFLAT